MSKKGADSFFLTWNSGASVDVTEARFAPTHYAVITSMPLTIALPSTGVMVMVNAELSIWAVNDSATAFSPSWVGVTMGSKRDDHGHGRGATGSAPCFRR